MLLAFSQVGSPTLSPTHNHTFLSLFFLLLVLYNKMIPNIYMSQPLLTQRHKEILFFCGNVTTFSLRGQINLLVIAHLNINDNSFNINSKFYSSSRLHISVFISIPLFKLYKGFRICKDCLKKVYSFMLPFDLTVLIIVIFVSSVRVFLML